MTGKAFRGSLRYEGVKTPKKANLFERWFSILLGSTLALYILKRCSLIDIGLVLASGFLLLRGVKGKGYVNEKLGLNTSSRGLHLQSSHQIDHERPKVVKVDDDVLEASWESFPASDPPAWTG